MQQKNDLPRQRKPELDAAYREMAKVTAREREALKWAEATISDVAHEPIEEK